MNPALATLVAIGGALLGTFVGSRLTRGNEDRKWRRDRATDAYSDFLLAVEMVRLEAHKAYLGPDCGTAEHAKQRAVVHDTLAEMYRAQQRASLVAPYTVYLHMATLGLHVVEEIGAKWTTCPKIVKSEINSTLEKYAQLMLLFTNSARNDLNVSSALRKGIPTKTWWQIWR
jgi:hypothetical protein